MNKAKFFLGFTALGLSTVGVFLLATGNTDEVATETPVTVETVADTSETVADTSPPTIILPSGEIMVEEGGGEQIPEHVIDTPHEVANWFRISGVFPGYTVSDYCQMYQYAPESDHISMNELLTANGLLEQDYAAYVETMTILCG